MNLVADVKMEQYAMNNSLVSGRFEHGIKLGFEMSRQGIGPWKISGLIFPADQQLQGLVSQNNSPFDAV